MKLRRTKAAVITAWIAVILWMTFIFSMSAQPAELSKQTSGGVAELVLSLIIPDFEDMSAEQQTQMIEDIQFFVRKGAHFCIYALLGVLLCLAFSGHIGGIAAMGGAALLSSALYAASDELHQRFVPGRSGELGDVMLDSSGALTGIVVCCFIIWLVRCSRRG